MYILNTLLLLLALACAPKAPPAAPHATTPAPFPAAQLREAMPPGTVMRLAVTTPEGVTELVWEVIAADAEGMTMRVTTPSPEGGPPAVSEGRSLWTELESHAHFPADRTQRSEGVIETALGRHEVTTAVVTEGATVSTYHFALSMPGPPILMVVTEHGQELRRMEILSRSTP